MVKSVIKFYSDFYTHVNSCIKLRKDRAVFVVESPHIMYDMIQGSKAS